MEIILRRDNERYLRTATQRNLGSPRSAFKTRLLPFTKLLHLYTMKAFAAAATLAVLANSVSAHCNYLPRPDHGPKLTVIPQTSGTKLLLDPRLPALLFANPSTTHQFRTSPPLTLPAMPTLPRPLRLSMLLQEAPSASTSTTRSTTKAPLPST